MLIYICNTILFVTSPPPYCFLFQTRTNAKNSPPHCTSPVGVFIGPVQLRCILVVVGFLPFQQMGAPHTFLSVSSGHLWRNASLIKIQSQSKTKMSILKSFLSFEMRTDLKYPFVPLKHNIALEKVALLPHHYVRCTI